MTTTWWKRCYEGLRGAFCFTFFLRIFTGRVGGCWVVLCLFVCLLCFGTARKNLHSISVSLLLRISSS